MPQSLLSDFKEYIKIMNQHDFYNDEIINIDSCRFLSPTFLLPLMSFVFNYDKKVKEPQNPITNKHLLKILGLKEHNDTTFPFRQINKAYDNSFQLTTEILKIMNYPKQNDSVLKFIFYELINNVYDHSNFDNGFVIGQNYPNVNISDFCFMDNGISIPGSFKKYDYPFENDCDAIIQAINGVSTKNEKEFIERGTGLNNTVNIVTNGGNGAILFVSGTGLIYITKNRVIAKTIPEHYIKGTLISVRFKNDKKINIYDNLNRIEFELPKNIKLLK